MRLLERDGPLAALDAARQDAVEGRGSVVLVTGEPGIGKTALMARFAADHRDDTRLLWGNCDDLSIPRPLGPFRDLAAATDLAETANQDAAHHRFHTVLLEELTSPPPPTVLVLEDVHWADQATVDAVTVIGRRIAALPAMLVLTYRSGELDPGHPLPKALDAIRSSVSLYLQLAPLSPTAVASLAGDHAEQVYTATGGNPFYVTEMIAALPGGLPASVTNAVVGRASRLPEESRRLVELVSMVPTRTRTKVLDLVIADWALAAEEPERRQLLVVEPQHVRFRHELARAAISSSLPASRRRLINAEILEALLASGADPAEIVYHAELAGNTEVVADYALVAARRAAAVGSNREAYAHYARTGDFAARLPAGEQAALYEEFAWISYLVGRMDEAFATIQRAIEIHEEMGDKEALGRCTRILSRLHWYAGDGEAARREAEAAIAILEPRGESAELARAYSGISQLEMLASHDEAALKWGDKAVDLAERLDEPGIRSHALVNIGVVRSNRDPDDQSALLEAFDLADAIGDRHEAVRALIGLVFIGLIWVRPAESARYAAQGIRYAEEHQVDTLLAYLKAADAWLMLRAGDWEAAERAATAEVERGVTVAQLLSKTVLTELAVRRGDASAGENLAELREQADLTGELQRIGPVLELEMEWAMTRGEPWPEQRFRQVMETVGADAVRTPGGGRLLGWAGVAGIAVDLDAPMPAPHAEIQRRDWAAAARAFGDAGWDYDRALMLSLLDDKAPLGEALDIARRLGAIPLEERLTRRLRRLGMTVPARPRAATRENPAGLTPRQLEVLELLGEGLTNAEIAQRLYVSVRTVEHHVEAIFGKLGVSNRREAARYAVLGSG